MQSLVKSALSMTLLVVASETIFASANPSTPVCSAQKIDEILAPATSARNSVSINCSVKLPAQQRITKRLIFRGEKASNVHFDCNGAEIHEGEINRGKDMIEVSSEKANSAQASVWKRPENIVIRNCKIYGSIRVKGLAANGEGELLRDSSRSLGHTERAQQSAPQNIRFYRMKIYGTGRIPLYFAPGVTYSGLYSSEVAGESNSVAIYFDAESAFNVLHNNSIHTKTVETKYKVLGVTVHKRSRELIAVDGSAHNLIVGNRFSSLNHGGIFLYRNCGEGGTVRHQSPMHNQIIDNIFYYKNYDGEIPAIWIGSRNGGRKYCNDDKGYAFGSSADNGDFASHNIVAKNQIYKFSPEKMIRNAGTDNRIFANETVKGVAIDRQSACFKQAAYPNEILMHGQSTQLFSVADAVVCKATLYSCQDGILQQTPQACQSLPEVKAVEFECKADGNNNGCRSQVKCPGGKRVVGVKAACNLEYGKVSRSQLKSVAGNSVEVLRSSDRASDGECHVDTVVISKGSASLAAVIGRSSLNFSCQERDRNGGDCHILGQMLCLE